LQPSRGRGAWERALELALAVAVAGFAGCGGDPKPPAPDADLGPTWWQPKVGEAKNWDIQLNLPPDPSAPSDPPIDVSQPRAMYDLELWSLVPLATMLDYGDDKPVMVPAGPLAGTIAQLHARTPSTIVICHVETGAFEMNRPDAAKFPASAIGEAVPGLPGARFLDVSAAGRTPWSSIMWKRFDLARSIGCDGIEPAHNDAGAFTSGFMVKTEDSLSWYAEVAMQGHMRMLSTGMKGGDEDQLGGAIDMGADQFDWLMIERCGEHKRCDRAQPFLQAHKPVFAIDYNFDDGTEPDPPRAPMPQDYQPVCMEQDMANIADGIYKDVALTSSNVRKQCAP